MIQRLMLTLLLLLPTVPVVAQENEQGEGEDKGSYAEWSVTEPPGDWETITIDTDEVTWSDVDVSPDGETLVFHTLGDIYTVPTEGGDATALTSDLAWNFQPRYSPEGDKIAFVSDRDGAENIWIMNADGTNVFGISNSGEMADIGEPEWRPTPEPDESQ